MFTNKCTWQSCNLTFSYWFAYFLRLAYVYYVKKECDWIILRWDTWSVLPSFTGKSTNGSLPIPLCMFGWAGDRFGDCLCVDCANLFCINGCNHFTNKKFTMPSTYYQNFESSYVLTRLGWAGKLNTRALAVSDYARDDDAGGDRIPEAWAS